MCTYTVGSSRLGDDRDVLYLYDSMLYSFHCSPHTGSACRVCCLAVVGQHFSWTCTSVKKVSEGQERCLPTCMYILNNSCFSVLYASIYTYIQIYTSIYIYGVWAMHSDEFYLLVHILASVAFNTVRFNAIYVAQLNSTLFFQLVVQRPRAIRTWSERSKIRIIGHCTGVIFLIFIYVHKNPLFMYYLCIFMLARCGYSCVSWDYYFIFFPV